jgi:hypothetical protein
MVPIGESLDIRADGLQLTLSGMPSSLISAVLGQSRYGKPGRLYFACLTSSGAVITDPYLTFSGKFDQPEISDGGDTCTISVRYENTLIDLQRRRVRHYTHEDQLFEYPADVGFEYVATLQDKQVPWGR